MVKMDKGTALVPSRSSSGSTQKMAANITVVVRVRPMNDRELGQNNRMVVEVIDENQIVFDPKEDLPPFFYQGVQQPSKNYLKRANKELKFAFDSVFGPNATNQDVFESATKDMLAALMEGYNCLVFAYGATGAGKTFTMIGSKEYPGITYLTMDHLFQTINGFQMDREFDIGVSYIEVYNENVFDLLKPTSTPLQFKDFHQYGVTVAGLSIHKIETVQELLDMLEFGNQNRTQHPTDANAESSRSHAVFQVPANYEGWKKIELGFQRKWNFPGCCGALDGKHIALKAPPEAGSTYYNYKHTNSIVLTALVDDDYCFSYIDVGCNGRVSDGGVFRNCSLSSSLENNMIPDNYVLVGDNAFPLKSYLMKPFPGNNLTLKQKVFNYRLSRARRIVENAFGILVGRFRIFERPIAVRPDKVDKIVKACCALHNWLRKTKSDLNAPTVDSEDTLNGRIIPGSWRAVPSQGLSNLPRTDHNHSSRESRTIRDNYADYFVGEGSVSWQSRMVH